MNLHRQLFQKRKGKEFKMLRINTKCTLSPVCYLSRLKFIKSPANAYQLLEKKKRRKWNKQGTRPRPQEEKGDQQPKKGSYIQFNSILSGILLLFDSHFVTLQETYTFQGPLLSSSYS